MSPARLLAHPALRTTALLAPLVLLFSLIYVGSLVRMLLTSIDYASLNFQPYVDLLSDRNILHSIRSTITMAALVTVICVVISYPVAITMARSSALTAKIITWLIVLPMWISTLVRSYAWIVLLGRQGVTNNLLVGAGIVDRPVSLLYTPFSVYVGLIYVLLPFSVFPIYNSIKLIDQRLLGAARSLGASRFIAMAAIFFPLTLPGAAVGSVLVFVMALSYWVTPTLLGGPGDTTFVMIIEKQINLIGNMQLGSAMAVVLLVVTVAILLVFQKVLGFGSVIGASGTYSNSGQKLVRMATRALVLVTMLGRRGPSAAAASESAASYAEGGRLPDFSRCITFLTIVFFLVPILILIPLSFGSSAYLKFPPTDFSWRWYEAYFGDRDWITATFVSLRVAAATAVIGVVIGAMAALALAKASFPFRGALLAVILSPLLVPNIITAVSLYFQLSPLGLIDTQTGLILGHLVLATPFVVMVIMGALQNFDFNLEKAARSLGAGPLTAFRTVMLPLIASAVVTAAFFAFIISFDEVVVAVFVSGPSAPTLPKQLLNATRFELSPTIAAISVILVAGTTLLVLGSELAGRLLRRHEAKRAG
ncbi:MAG: ABC transporter permease subunit [Parvibaculaceae bacterium]